MEASDSVFNGAILGVYSDRDAALFGIFCMLDVRIGLGLRRITTGVTLTYIRITEY